MTPLKRETEMKEADQETMSSARDKDDPSPNGTPYCMGRSTLRI